jgi:type IV secretion system protein VirB10
VRRLNRAPLFIAMAILAIIAATIAYTYWLRLQTARPVQTAGATAKSVPVLMDAPGAGFIPPKAPEAIPVLAPPPAPPQPAPPRPEPEDPDKAAWLRYLERAERIRAAREQLALQAVESPTKLQAVLAAPNAAASTERVAAAPAPASASDQFVRLAAAKLAELGGGERDRDLNRQDEKQGFLSERDPRTLDENTLKSRREAPRSIYEVKAGTVIPAVMIGGLDSDLPGVLLAQVSQNVYDTATGRFILIPQGSKLIGVYDANATTGQERVLVAWTRIIYPDASSLDLGRMPGADEAGYAGFTDQVNTHFWKVWGNALLMSAFSAGVQLSQGNAAATNGSLNTSQTIAAAMGQQLGQLGMEMARRNMQIQPTLEIRPGYRFAVMVTKDMILRPWISRGAAGAR